LDIRESLLLPIAGFWQELSSLTRTRYSPRPVGRLSYWGVTAAIVLFGTVLIEVI
jgi:hypothetical protein